MITLIHGGNTVASRAELATRIKALGDIDVRRLDGATLDEAMLIQALESPSLFGGQTAVVIENLFGKLGRKLKLIEALAKRISESGDGMEILLWEDKDMGKTVISGLGEKARVVQFKISPLIFEFLDALQPNNSHMLISLSEKLFSQDAPELVFAMLVKRLRQLLMLRDGGKPEGLIGWQAGRLTTQAGHFTLEQLHMMYRKCRDIEYSIKSGTSPFTMAQHIEMLLTDIS
jgi:DNA polymerase III delta subunit